MVNMIFGRHYSRCSTYLKPLPVPKKQIKMGRDLKKYIAVLPNYDKLAQTRKDLVPKFFNKELFHKNFGNGKVVGFEIVEKRDGSNLEISGFNGFMIVKFKNISEKKRFLLERADEFLRITGEKKYRGCHSRKIRENSVRPIF